MPRATMASGAHPVMSRPSRVTEPSIGLSNPKIALMRVDFPAPFGPMTATISPESRESDTPRRIGTSLYPTVRLLASRSANLASQVRFEDRWVGADFGGFPFRDHAALMHDDDPVAPVEHHVHVVFNQEERLATLAEILDEGEDLEAEGRIDAGDGLVEQDERRVHDEDSREFEEFFLAARKVPRGFIGQLREPDEGQQIPRLPLQLLFPSPDPSQPE